MNKEKKNKTKTTYKKTKCFESNLFIISFSYYYFQEMNENIQDFFFFYILTFNKKEKKQ